MHDPREALSLSAPINTCREMAAEAQRRAAAEANLVRRTKYLDLARQWTELADEMERAMAALEDQGHRFAAKKTLDGCDALSDRLEATTDASDISS